ncbi:MerR family transcriptional regulator [Vibrio sp. F74]|uniref:MerR family transcriptional regulator n=1 Tax=Vibrio sp. F74 TaxID=700020 RepID=UPI0035F56D06
MMTTELAKYVGVTSETVRFYTRKGLLSATRLPTNGYKFYGSEAIARLKFITQAKNVGFSLKEIEEIIALSELGTSPCPKVREMLGIKIIETKQNIGLMNQHLTMMEDTLSEWASKPDMEPDGKAVCCLIEQWSNDFEYTQIVKGKK